MDKLINHSKNKITIANWIAIIGFAVLGVFTFIGRMYQSFDGSIGISVIYSIVTLGLLSFLLITIIKAKKATDHFNLWKIVEFSGFVFYLLVAYLTSSPFTHYIHISVNKEKLQERGIKDIQDVRIVFKSYNKWVDDNINKTREDLKNVFTNIDTPKDASLARYLNRQGLSDANSINSWIEKVRSLYALTCDDDLPTLSNSVNEWNIMHIARISKIIYDKSTSVDYINTKITNVMKTAEVIPIIKYSELEHSYVYDNCIEKTFCFKFKDSLYDEMKGNETTPFDWIVLILIHLLILLNYVVTCRDSISRPKSKIPTGGIPL